MSRNADSIRRLRAAAVLRGDCMTCRCRPAKPGRKTCQHCLDDGRRQQAALEARRRRARRCPTCGQKPARGFVQCAACLDKSAARMRRVVARGLCSSCYSDRGVDGSETLCRACADKLAAKARVRHAAKIAAGLCVRDGCGAMLESKTLCFGHLLEQRRRSRARVQEAT